MKGLYASLRRRKDRKRTESVAKEKKCVRLFFFQYRIAFHYHVRDLFCITRRIDIEFMVGLTKFQVTEEKIFQFRSKILTGVYHDVLEIQLIELFQGRPHFDDVGSRSENGHYFHSSSVFVE